MGKRTKLRSDKKALKKKRRVAATLATDVYRQVYRAVESFEVNNVGADLAYLMGAILTDDFIEWPETCPIVAVLRGIYKSEESGHPVWTYIVVSPVDDMSQLAPNFEESHVKTP